MNMRLDLDVLHHVLRQLKEQEPQYEQELNPYLMDTILPRLEHETLLGVLHHQCLPYRQLIGALQLVCPQELIHRNSVPQRHCVQGIPRLYHMNVHRRPPQPLRRTKSSLA